MGRQSLVSNCLLYAANVVIVSKRHWSLKNQEAVSRPRLCLHMIYSRVRLEFNKTLAAAILLGFVRICKSS